MFGLSIKNLKVSNIKIKETSEIGIFFPDDFIVYADVEYIYKKKKYEKRIPIYTNDSDIFYYRGVLYKNRVDKAEYIINQLNKKSFLIRRILEKDIKYSLKNEENKEKGKELLVKYL